MSKLGVLLFFFSHVALGQFTVEGMVTDTTLERLADATIIVKDSTETIVGYCITNNKGEYRWSTDKKKVYTITANYLGYDSVVVVVGFVENSKVVRNIILQPSSKKLKEVVVQAQRTVRRTNDTITYNAKALSTGNEYTVEELLQNIPGITITEDGTISYKGSTIDKVLVEGDDLLSAAYATLTKNMPSKALSTVQILEHYSRNKLLKGIENSEAVAINLTIDKKHKAVWFGNGKVGGGYKNQYIGNLNVMRFSKTHKTFLNVSTNNLGVDGVESIAEKQFGGMDLETIGRNKSSEQVLHNSLGGLPIAKKRYNVNHNQKATVSTIMPLGKVTKLRIRGFWGAEKASRFHLGNTMYHFEDTFFENMEINRSSNTLDRQYISGLLTSEPSKNSLLKSLTTINWGKDNYHNNLNFNGIQSDERLKTDNLYIDEQLTYTYKWNKRSVVLLKGRFLYDDIPQKYHNTAYLMGDLFPYENISDVFNTTKSSVQYAGIQADVKLKQTQGDLLDFQLGIDYTSQKIGSLFQLISNNQLLAPENHQFNGSMALVDLYAKSAYNWEFTDFSIAISGDIHQLLSRYTSVQQQYTKTPFIINPNFILNWKLTHESNLSTSYNYRNRSTDFIQMTDGYLFNPSRSFKKGLGTFDVYGTHSINLNYAINHYLNRQGLKAGIGFQKNDKRLSTRSNLSQNSNVSETIFIEGGSSINAHAEVFKIVKPLKGIITAKFTGNKDTYFNYLNDSDLRKNTAYNYLYMLQWNSSFEGNFNFTLESEWNSIFIKTKTTTFTNTNKASKLELVYKPWQKLLIKAAAQHYYFDNLQEHNNYFFMDVNSRFNLKKDKYAITLSGVNLLNTQNFTRYQINDYSEATDSYSLISRYVLLEFEFNF